MLADGGRKGRSSRCLARELARARRGSDAERVDPGHDPLRHLTYRLLDACGGFPAFQTGEEGERLDDSGSRGERVFDAVGEDRAGLGFGH